MRFIGVEISRGRKYSWGSKFHSLDVGSYTFDVELRSPRMERSTRSKNFSLKKITSIPHYDETMDPQSKFD